jgi:hypothetical protein
MFFPKSKNARIAMRQSRGPFDRWFLNVLSVVVQCSQKVAEGTIFSGTKVSVSFEIPLFRKNRKKAETLTFLGQLFWLLARFLLYNSRKVTFHF